MSDTKLLQPKENKMGTQPIWKLIITLSLPMVVSMIIQALYNVIDSLFVASISPEQLEFNAVNLSFAAQNLIIAVATGTGVGINALLSKSLGEKNFERAEKIARNGVFLALCSYIVFLALGLTLIGPYMKIMTDNPQVIEYGKQYLFICYIGSFGIFGEIVMERLMISTGKTYLAMITQATGAIINIIFDPIFIFGCGMGVRGAALATVLGQIVAFGVAIILNRKFNKDIHLSFRKFRPDSKIIGKIYAIGVPSIVMASIGSVMNIILNNILYSFAAPTGLYAQNAFGAFFKLQSFILMPIFGLNNGLVPLIAYNYGAQKRKRMISAMLIGGGAAVSYMVMGLAAFELFPRQLAGMFIEIPAALDIAVYTLRIAALSFVFAGICIVMGSVFQALGKSIFSMFTSIARQLVVLVPAAYLLAKTGDVNNVWWAFPIAEIMSLIMSVLFFIIVYKKTISNIPE
ncbi:MAG: MATE family efflux transporter [Ruminococcaceae bacterium]|nr:MATE family efflux transporter [Oscillospiraceae bacterium]